MRTKWLNYLLPRVSTNYEQTQKNRILYIMLVAVFLGSLLIGILNDVQGWYRESTALFFMASVCLFGFVLAQKDRFIPAAIILCSVLIIVIDYVLYYGAGLYDAGVIVYPLYILCATFLFGRKCGILLATLVSIASVFGLYWLEKAGIFQPTFPASLLRPIVLSLLFSMTALAIWAVRVSWEANLQRMQESYDLTLEGWTRALEYRDGGTGNHTRRVAELSMALARRLRCSPQEIMAIRRGALLHDIGKMAIPDRILLKPGPLTAEEWEIMKKHPGLGREFVCRIPYLQDAAEIPYAHHEHWDGTGYPNGLKGEAIPLAARIFAVIDNWDALNSDRPYRKAWPRQAVIDYLQENAGRIFDPQVVASFMPMVRNGSAEISGEEFITG